MVLGITSQKKEGGEEDKEEIDLHGITIEDYVVRNYECSKIVLSKLEEK